MRVEFANSIVEQHALHPNLVFITGDLGYMALEKVEQTYGERFINAGVAEQNMVTVAAALAHEGFVPFVYSISPFVTLRPYEQIRNDVCLHNLPVKLVGNGGGYGYGIMGATHHNIEDIGAMRVLPNMKVYVPLVGTDVAEAVAAMTTDPSPNYLRLNMAAKLPFAVEPFAPWRKLKTGNKAVVVGTGPVLENICNSPMADELEVWAVSLFPISDVPEVLLESLHSVQKLIIIEEHRGECGLRETLSYHLLSGLHKPVSVLSLCAAGYPSGRYGDQKFHQHENALGGEPLQRAIEQFIV